MSQAKPGDVDPALKPKSSNSAVIVIVVVVVLAVMCIPAIFGALAVAGGVFAFWASDASPGRYEQMESMPPRALEASMQDASPPESSIHFEPQPAQP